VARGIIGNLNWFLQSFEFWLQLVENG